MSVKPAWVQRVQKEVALRRQRTAREEAQRERKRRARQDQEDRQRAQPIIDNIQKIVEQALTRGESVVPLMTWRTEYGAMVPLYPSELHGEPMWVARHCKDIGLTTTLEHEALPDLGEDDAVRYSVTLSITL